MPYIYNDDVPKTEFLISGSVGIIPWMKLLE